MAIGTGWRKSGIDPRWWIAEVQLGYKGAVHIAASLVYWKG